MLRDQGSQVVLQLADRASLRVPRSWTNADGDDGELRRAPTVFTDDSLRALMELVDAFVERPLS